MLSTCNQRTNKNFKYINYKKPNSKYIQWCQIKNSSLIPTKNYYEVSKAFWTLVKAQWNPQSLFEIKAHTKDKNWLFFVSDGQNT